MASRVSYATFDLTYPPWALDIDGHNRGYLVVAGGGGEGQKEVPNRITLLDIATRGAISKVAELDGQSDSPSSIGALTTKEGLIVYSGINDDINNRKKGKNEHFSSFKVDYPVKGDEKSQASITQIGQASLFSQSFCTIAGDPFQRILRLSPVKKSATGNKRIGAIANSLSPESEIIVFNATTASPTSADIIRRIQPIQNAEAEDIDIVDGTEDGDFLIAYCTKYEVYLSSMSYDFIARKPASPIQEPVCLRSAPFPDAFEKKGRSKYRSIRFLAKEHLLLLSNAGGRSELQILQIYPGGGSGDIILRKRLPKSMGSCVGLDVSILDADAVTGERQIVIAVAAQAEDIAVFTLDYAGPAKNKVSSFKTYKELAKVHKAPMKKVALSVFHKPQPPDGKEPLPQYLRLASISLSNILCVDDLPLHLIDTKTKGSRYVLTKPSAVSSAIHYGSSIIAVGFTLLVALLFVQSILSASTGTTFPSLIKMPDSWQQAIHSYRDMAGQLSQPISNRVHQVSDPAGHHLLDILHIHHKENKHRLDPDKKAVVITVPEADSAAPLTTEVHVDTADLLAKASEARKWEDLSEKQQKRWKERLTEAGQWSADYGETILKGVFFSEVAGAVGRAAAEALAG